MICSENKIIEQIVFYSCPGWKHVWHHMNHLSVPSRTVCFDSNLIPEQSAILYSSTYWSFHTWVWGKKQKCCLTVFFCYGGTRQSFTIMIVWRSSDPADTMVKQEIYRLACLFEVLRSEALEKAFLHSASGFFFLVSFSKTLNRKPKRIWGILKYFGQVVSAFYFWGGKLDKGRLSGWWLTSWSCIVSEACEMSVFTFRRLVFAWILLIFRKLNY